jgi:endonuclease YncB( thermonuclease family)
VIDGDTLRLVDGRTVRLIGALAPKATGAGAGALERKFAEQARQMLQDATHGGEVGLAVTGTRHDRHGRLLAQAFVNGDPGGWLQGMMIDQGLARAYALVDNYRCVRVLLDREAAARAGKRGMWANVAAGSFGAIRPSDVPAEIAGETGRFAIVEGRLVSVGERPRRTYLNFGTYWSEDFTAFVDSGDLPLFVEAGIVLGELEGRRVRVRGWVGEDRGPVIHMKRPEQLELVGEK